MDLMEYQGKELFRRYGIPTDALGEVAKTPDEAERSRARLRRAGDGQGAGAHRRPRQGRRCEVLQDARGGPRQRREASSAWTSRATSSTACWSSRPATSPRSTTCRSCTTGCPRATRSIASAEGGVDIEETNRTDAREGRQGRHRPHASASTPEVGAVDPQAASGCRGDALDGSAETCCQLLYQGFVNADATLFEVNPLISTPDGRVIALDAKVSIDNNAMFRHPELEELRRPRRRRGTQSLEAQGEGQGPAVRQARRRHRRRWATAPAW